MRYVLLLALLGCATPTKPAPVAPKPAPKADFRVTPEISEETKRMEWIYFDMRVENCKRIMDICGLKNRTNCFITNQACVVEAWRTYLILTGRDPDREVQEAVERIKAGKE